MKNKVKLILFDMDGTLLNEHKQVPASFVDVFHKLHEKGYVLGAASGRPWKNLQTYFPQIHQEMAFIAQNGGMIVYRNKVLKTQTIPLTLGAKIIERMQSAKDCSMLLCAKDATYYCDDDARLYEPASNYYPDMVLVDKLEDKKEVPCLKMTIYDYKDSYTNSVQTFQNIDEDLYAVSAGKEWCDVGYKPITKASGAKILTEHLGITFKEVMAFGDESNDYELLSQVSFSFAMDNALPAIKRICRYSCLSNEEEGVIHALKQHLL